MLNALEESLTVDRLLIQWVHHLGLVRIAELGRLRWIVVRSSLWCRQSDRLSKLLEGAPLRVEFRALSIDRRQGLLNYVGL